MNRSGYKRTDRDIQMSVQEELEWTRDVDADGIGIAVEDGTVALSGEVDSHAERLAAVRAAMRVLGVRALVDNLTVHPRADWPATETDVAKEVDRALRAAINVPDSVQAQIDGHNVALTGEVKWNYQREAAEHAVQYLRGVFSLDNLIALTPRPSAEDTAERIARALRRHAHLDEDAIHVDVSGTAVILTGVVHTWWEHQEAQRVARTSPHVTSVMNRLHVYPE